jgi:hypothetical protein
VVKSVRHQAGQDQGFFPRRGGLSEASPPLSGTTPSSGPLLLAPSRLCLMYLCLPARRGRGVEKGRRGGRGEGDKTLVSTRCRPGSGSRDEHDRVIRHAKGRNSFRCRGREARGKSVPGEPGVSYHYDATSVVCVKLPVRTDDERSWGRVRGKPARHQRATKKAHPPR